MGMGGEVEGGTAEGSFGGRVDGREEKGFPPGSEARTGIDM